MHIHYLQHVPFEGLAGIESWVQAHGHTLSATRFFAADPLPKLDDLDWLVVMGGPMNVYETDQHAWLTPEKRFIEQAIRAGKTVFGICLGAQLIADVLGARVRPNRHKEIGWFPIDLTPPAQSLPLFDFLPPRLTVFHWHGDTFDLPAGAVHVARSEACENQAFVYERKVVAFQFHLETMAQSVQALIQNCAHELTPGKYIQPADEILAHAGHVTQNTQLLNTFLERLQAPG